jgi:hypothetical protein
MLRALSTPRRAVLFAVSPADALGVAVATAPLDPLGSMIICLRRSLVHEALGKEVSRC